MSKKEVSPIVQTMLEQIQDGEPRAIVSALHVLKQEETLPTEAYEQLTPLLKHTEEEVRHAALFLFLLAPDELPEDIKIEICKFIGDKNKNIQSVIATFIGGKMPVAPEAIQKRVCKAITRSSDENFRISALSALTQWVPPLPETIALLVDMIHNGTDNEKRVALLGFDGFPELVSPDVAVSMFQLLKTSKNPAVRMMAANTLSSIQDLPKETKEYVLAFLADEKNMKAYLEAEGL